MRSASELMGILESEAEDFAVSTTAQTRLGIAVNVKEGGSVGDTIVWRDAKDREAILEALLKNGGEPIGLIRMADNSLNGGKITVDSSLFEEYRGDVATKTALKKICRTWGDEILEQLSQCGEPKVTYFGTSSDWLQ